MSPMLDFFLDDFYVSNELLTTPIPELEFCVMDFETTGLYPYNGDRIVEVGLVRINAEKILDTFDCLVNPKIPIPEVVSNINHITQEMVKNEAPIEDRIDSILEFIKNSVLTAHNLPFDLSFLNFQLQKMNRKKIDAWLVDTVKVAKLLLPQLPRFTLGHVTEFLKIKNTGAHRALGDAQATGRALQALIKKLPSHSTLKDLLAFKLH
jgi:ATP-dependent DNA helicase DinG